MQDQVEKWQMVPWVRQWGGIPLWVTGLTGELCITAVHFAGYVRPLGAQVFILVCVFAISFITLAGAILYVTTRWEIPLTCLALIIIDVYAVLLVAPPGAQAEKWQIVAVFTGFIVFWLLVLFVDSIRNHDEGPNQAMASHTAATPSSRGVGAAAKGPDDIQGAGAGAAEGPQTTAIVFVTVVSSEGIILSETTASLPLSHLHHMGELQGPPPPQLVS